MWWCGCGLIWLLLYLIFLWFEVVLVDDDWMDFDCNVGQFKQRLCYDEGDCGVEVGYVDYLEFVDDFFCF